MSGPVRLTVHYLDEDRAPQSAQRGWGALVAVERRWPAGAPMLEGLAFAAWVSLGNSPDDSEGFEKFLLEIRDIEAGEVESLDPSQPAASDA